ncbi:MAG TPA: hypothetical protein VMJ12_07400 [Candidatus Acidoferrales bacterium]|nr:hypothetical protein [Candidatus Acidoferrales bacterium]
METTEGCQSCFQGSVLFALKPETPTSRWPFRIIQHYLRTVRVGNRATEFRQRCDGLEISGVSLHSYRYTWAEPAKTAGYPERFAQEALGHNSKAVHWAYARKAKVELPPLSEYEQQRKQFTVLPAPARAARN